MQKLLLVYASRRVHLSFFHHMWFLDVNIAKRTAHRVQQIAERHSGGENTEVDFVIEGRVPGGRHVVDGDGAGDDVQTVPWVLVLPDPEDAVDLGVVQVEGWVAGGGVEVLGGDINISLAINMYTLLRLVF